jgi:hypothetical protein
MFATRLVLLLLASIPLAACDEPGDATAVPDRSPPPGSFMHGAFEGKVPSSSARATIATSRRDRGPSKPARPWIPRE